MSVKYLSAPRASERDGIVPWNYCSMHKSKSLMAEGAGDTTFLTKDYYPDFEDGVHPNGDSGSCPTYAYDKSFSRIVGDKLMPCDSEHDEKIMMITIRGTFMQKVESIKLVEASQIFCCEGEVLGFPCAHLIVRLDKPTGYVVAGLGRNHNLESVLTFEWNGGAHKYTPDQFEALASDESSDS